MSTLREVIDLVDGIKPNAFDDAVKVAWLASLDQKIAVNVMLLSREDAGQIRYSTGNMDAQLLVGAPYEDIYEAWLCAKIDFANGEAEKYQNSITMYNAIYDEFVVWYAMTYDPVQGDPEKGPACYLTAYALAVKAGFQGTVEEWLESLVGPKGDTGATGIQGPKGETGASGKDGKAPVKGTDYWTPADKKDIVNDVLRELPTWEGGSY